MTVEDRGQVLGLVAEAVAQGSRQHTACEMVGVAAPGDGQGWTPGAAHGSTEQAVTA